MARKKPDSGGSIRTRRGKASIGFAGVVMAGLLAGAGWLHLTGQWGVVAGATEMQYREWFEALVNDPNNEEYRARLIQHAVEHYRETPEGKSLPLRDEAGRVVGRFRIHEAKIDQPYADSDETAQRRIYTVALIGGGELWHETGGRVRFTGKAFVTYQVDFKVQDWAAYAYFTCLSIEREWFECLHIDNILGQIFKAAVRNAGKRALVECLEPGFTIIAKPNGDTWLAFGHVGKEFKPRTGPFDESDRDCECECNDVTLLHAGYRDYLGPIELFEGNELRVTIETESLDARKSFGVDVYLLSEEEFQRYEQAYPGKLKDLPALKPMDQRLNMQKLNHTFKGLKGNVYLLVDNTGLSGERRPSDGLVRYYVRIKR
ncbi:MAG: hypothetical protein KF696_04885 [Planctomycetes bacterium]|nr:hypothetical protein [Planctomycetota bacterium]MCW8134309.1 hypothetical protein [Planctomycetota bacterium]